MILVPICNRTNYTKLRPILKLLPISEVGIITSSSILLELYGNAYQDIEKDGFNIVDSVDCLMANDTLDSMSKTIATSLIEHTNIYKRLKPKTVLAVGDRFDMLPAVLAARLLNIPIFHIQGGEKTGSIDDTVRAMISVSSERHYVATEKAKEEVIRLTHSENVFNFGCPAVEQVVSIPILDSFQPDLLQKKYKTGIPIKSGDKFLLVCVHPNTTDCDINMDVLLDAVLSFGLKSIVLYPNADSLHDRITSQIRKRASKLILIRHSPMSDFVQFMYHSSCMIGNSSAGIREAASFGTPVVNIGKRQNGRERNKNTIDVSCEYQEIAKAIQKSLNNGKYPTKNIYYKQNASKNIAQDIIEHAI